VEWLKTQTPAGSSIVCLPYVKGTSAAEYEPTTVWMYWGMAHGRPLVNGYTGFFPPDYTEVKAALQKFPDHASVEVLTQRKVRYCVVERSLATEEAIANNPTVWHRLRWVHGDDASKLDIYELLPLSK
jgi:hypothetical protein